MVDPVSLGLGAGGVIAAPNTPAVAKLVETVSAGLGNAVAPLQIRRNAKAEAQALVTNRGFVTEEARILGFTLDDLRAWKPAATASSRGRKKKDVA